MVKKFSDFLMLDEGVNDPGIFKAVFLAGGPGSGKSFMVGKTALTAFGLKILNSDDLFEAGLRKAMLEPTPEAIFSKTGQSIRDRAKALTGKRMNLYLSGRLGLVIDGTGKDVAKITRQSEQLKKLGYDVSMIFVNTDLDTALERNRKRPRKLPDNVVKQMWNSVQNNIGHFQRMFRNNFIVVDNSEGSDVDAQALSAYRQIQSFVNAPLQNNVAREWMKKQQNRQMQESLKDWFGKGAKGDWVRVGTDGEIKGACAREPGEGKPKCMPRSRAHGMDKEDRAKSARRKRRKDPDVDRPGTGNKPINVKTEENIDEKCWDGWKQVGMKKKGKKMVPNCVPEELEPLGKLSKLKPVKSPEQKALAKKREKKKVFKNIEIVDEDFLLEKSKPTNPALWARAKAAARSKFDVYPSAYANGWAVQWYKKRGGGWRTVKEENLSNLDERYKGITIKDKALAKTVYKTDYEKAKKTLTDFMRAEKKKNPKGKLRHDAGYYAWELIGGNNKWKKFMNSRLLASMVNEEYEATKHEWGTEEGTEYYKSITPGEKSKKKKVKEDLDQQLEPLGCDNKIEIDIEKDISKHEYRDKNSDEADSYYLTNRDIFEMERFADSLTWDDMLELDMYDEEELEEVEETLEQDLEEELSIQGRMKRRFAARRNRQKLKVARARRLRMASGPDRIKMRAQRGARNMMKSRLARGRDVKNMPPAEKARLEKMVKRFAPIVAKIAQRMVPQMRRQEITRLKKRGRAAPQKAKKFSVKKGASASKYKAKKFKLKKK